MLLSIGMIVKNEADKHLRDCLTSFKPILEQVHSELIIYDTGSTDNTVDICREFTPHVFQIEWRGDFAWARNHTVDRARGKWFMFIDADEIFEDVADIIRFFNSEEYRKYNSASYRWKNLHAGGRFSYFRPLRLFKMGKDTRFAGKIHEYLPTKTPIKHLESMAAHYGYLYEGETAKEDRLKKHERNILPMLEIFEENPTDKRNISHIIAAYETISNMDKVKEYIQYGLDAVGDNPNEIYYHVFISKHTKALMHDEAYEKAVVEIDNYFYKITTTYENAPELLTYKGRALDKLKKHEESIAAFKEALDMYDRFEKGKLDSGLSMAASFESFTSEKEEAIIYYVCKNYAALHNFDSAIMWSKKLKTPGKLYNTWVVGALKEKDAAFFTALYKYAIQMQPSALDIYDNIISAMETYGLGEANAMLIADAILAANEDSDYSCLMALRKAYYENELTNELDYFLSSDKPFHQHYGDVMLIAMAHRRDFSVFINNLHITNTARFSSQIIRSYKNTAAIVLAFFETGLPESMSVKYMRVLSAFFLHVFEKNMEATALLENTMRLRHRYLSAVYKPELYSAECAPLLHEQDSFVFYVGTAYACKDSGDTLGFIRSLRLALHANPTTTPVISAIIDEIQQAESATAPPDVHNELAQETTKLKALIKTLIAIGNIGQAAQILDSYAEVNPSDPDIEQLRARIGAKQ